MSTDASSIFVVLGMHRGGTSAITRGLKVLGVDLGTNLIPASIGVNDRGFWEDAEINAINIRLLNALNVDWHSLSPPDRSGFLASDARDLIPLALNLLGSRTRSHLRFGLKDPRLPVLLPFWQNVFAQLGLTPHYVISCRNPLSVARSLATRDGFDPCKSHLLWLSHMFSSWSDTLDARRVVVDYDRLLDAPGLQLERIARGLGLHYDPHSDAAAEYVDNFLTESLRHSRFGVQDLQAEAAVPSLTKDLYLALQQAASDSVSADDARLANRIEALQQTWFAMRPALTYLDDCERQLFASRSRVRVSSVNADPIPVAVDFPHAGVESHQPPGSALRDDTQRIKDLESAVAERAARIAALTAQEAQRETHLSEITRSLQESERRRIEISEDATQHLAQLRNLEVLAADRARQVDDLKMAAATSAKRLTETEAALLQSENRVREISLQACEYLTRLERADACIAAQKQAIEEMEKSASLVAERLATLETTLQASETRLADARKQALADVARFKELEALIDSYERKIYSLSTSAAESALRESALETAIAERGHRLTHLGAELELHVAQAKIMSERASTAEARASALALTDAQSRARIEALQDTVQAMRSSRSWQLTKPLRGTGTLLRSAKRLKGAATNFAATQGGLMPSIRRIRRIFGREGWGGVRSRMRRATTREVVTVPTCERTMESDQRHPDAPGTARAALARQLAHMDYQPLISVVMPTYNTPIDLLHSAIDSVKNQVYANWELCICDDGSNQSEVRRALATIADSDPRIRIAIAPKNGGISAATNRALALASGEFVALLDHDDTLTPDALAEIVLALDTAPEADVIYSDQDKIDAAGRRFEPFFKPDWSPDLFRRVMYVGHLLVFRRSLLEKVGLLDSRFDKVQDYEFMLRLSEHTQRIHHIPKILYHWRAISGSIALDPDGKGDIERLQVEAVQAHLGRAGRKAAVSPHPRFSHRAVIEPDGTRDDGPLVSIIIPSKDAAEHISRCLDSIFLRSTYRNFEVIVVDNGTTERAALAALDRHPVVVLPFAETFNFSRANNLGASHARGEYLLFLNNDTEVITPDWLERLVFNLQQDDVAAVGPLLLYPDNTVQHAGVVLGCRGTADHVMRGFPGDSDGYAGSLSCTREVSAVTAACMMCRRADYMAIGGMIEYFATHYQDVDLCMRLAQHGKRILFVPDVALYHFESATRGQKYDYLDRLLLLDSWGEQITNGDPFYNRNLSIERLDYSVSEPSGGLF